MPLKRTGLQLVAEGADSFNRALDTANTKVNTFGKTLLLVADKSGNVQGTITQLENVGKAGQKAGQSLDKVNVQGFGEKLQRGVMVGVGAMDLLFPALAKNNAELLKLRDTAQTVSGTLAFGAAFGTPGLVVGGIAAAVELVQNRWQELEQEVITSRQPFEDIKTTVEEIGQATDPLARKLQDAFRLPASTATDWAGAARQSAGFAKSLSDFAELDARMAALGVRIKQIREALANTPPSSPMYKVLVADLQAAQAELAAMTAKHDAEKGALNQEADAVLRGAAAWTQYELAVQKALGVQDRIADPYISTTTRRINEQAARMDAQRKIAGNTSEDFDTLSASLANNAFAQDQEAEAIARNNEALAKQEAALQREASILSGMVSKALAPTYPTEKEMKTAKAGGQTPKHWDELARQAEDVALRPNTLGKYKDLQAALQETGMSAEAFAQGFRDMSLFADPKNLKFADLSVVTANVQQQLKAMAGEANLTQAALQEVWKNLSPAEKQSLAKAGIGSAEDALKQMLNPAQKAKDDVAGLNEELGQVPESKTTTFDNVKSSTFDPNLDQVLTDLSKIPANADTVVTLTYVNGGTDSGGDTTDSGGDTGDGHGVTAMWGGAWTVPPGGQWAFLHGGEDVWVSGTNHDVPFPGRFAQKMGLEPAGLGGITKGDFEKGKDIFGAPGLNFSNSVDVFQWMLTRRGELESIYQNNPAFWDALMKQYHGNYKEMFDAAKGLFTGERNPFPDQATHTSGGGGGGGGTGGGTGGGGSMEGGTIIIKGAATIVLDPNAARLGTGNYTVAPPLLGGLGGGSVQIDAPVTFPGLIVNNPSDIQAIGSLVQQQLLGLRNQLLANWRTGGH